MNATTLPRLLPPLLCIAALAVAPLPAQSGTRAWSQALTGCEGRPPADSLRPQLADPVLVRADGNGLFAVDMEMARIASGWSLETARAGFTGFGYLRWAGPNLYSSPGSGVLTYRLDNAAAGRFRIALHNRHENGDPSLENDCWIRVNGGTWWKLYSNDGSNVRVWNWHSRLDPGHGYADFDLVAGINTIEVSGRSTGFQIDRMHVFPTSLSNAFGLSAPVLRQNERPVVGATFGVWIDDPQAQTDLRPGLTVCALLLAHRPNQLVPCGRVLPGFGRTAAERGELLLLESPPPVVVPVTVVWGGPGHPAAIDLPIPARSELVGTIVHSQALMFDGRRAVLTNGLRFGIGDS
ncbi:MAG: hypothetical protein IPM29_24095 [Planctomycetes bacterium]|nr:hypothetical protein [Planctomycetota bacterium]